jgi:hypothetical protein
MTGFSLQRASALIFEMAETFKCCHCGAAYEITHDKAVSLAHCEICGKQMEAGHGYELVKMPDGTNV